MTLKSLKAAATGTDEEWDKGSTSSTKPSEKQPTSARQGKKIIIIIEKKE